MTRALIKYQFVVYIIVCILGCKSSKNIQTFPKEITEHILLDSLVITPETHGEFYVSDVSHVTPTRTMDLLHTELHLVPNWRNQVVDGIATLTLTPFAYPADTLILNAQFFDIHEVSINNTAQIIYAYDGALLHIPLGQQFLPGQSVNCKIKYTAHPHNASSRQKQGFFFIDPFDTIPNLPQQIWTIGETQYNSQWFPTIDFPNERHTQDIRITVDTSFVTVSNGALVSSQTQLTGMRTDQWVMMQSHAPYLTLLVVGDYDVVRDTWNGIPVNYYVDKGYGPSAKEIFAHTPEMLSFFSELLAYPYPWPKFDQVVVHDFTAGAMENTSAVTFATDVQRHSREFLVTGENDGIVAHEMFHQWFGDLLTCESWAHLALNEGFANYGEYLWTEFKYGADEAQRLHLSELQGYLAATDYGIHPLIHFDYGEPDEMFDAHSYNKGSLVLHHLRSVLGDEVFLGGLRKYLNDNAFKAVEIHDLRLAMEEVSGKDLNLFFDQWYFTAGHPEVSISEYYNLDLGQIQITLTQLQDPSTSRAAFQFPLTVQFLYNDHDSEFVHLEVSEREQVFTLSAPSMPDAIVYDPEGSLVWEIAPIERTADQYRLLLQHNNTWQSRNEAMNYLFDHFADFSTEELRSALSDPHWELRQNLLYSLDLKGFPGLNEDVISLANNDPDRRVRLAAAYCLGELEDPQYAQVFVDLLGAGAKVDEIIIGLLQLSKCDFPKALTYSQHFVQDSSISVLSMVASVFAVDPDPVHTEFFRKNSVRIGEEGKNFFHAYAFWASGLEDSLISNEVAALKSLALAPKTDLYTRFYATYSLWVLQSILPADRDISGIISSVITEIRELTSDATLTEWYRSFD